MRFVLPLVALAVVGCGSKEAPDDSGAAPSTTAASLKGASVPPATTQVDGSKPYSQRGDK